MTDIDYSTTPLQKKIYVLLINYKNPRFPHTQKQVCEQLGISKSTCSDATKKLIALEFISPIPGSKTNILYRKGKHHKIMESHINANYLESGEWFDTYGEGIRPSNIAEPYKPTYRAHVNGTWLMFTVLHEGDIESINDKKTPLPQVLFGKRGPSELPGSLNWWGSLNFAGAWTSIRYQKSESKKLFYIQPPCKIMVASELTPDEDIMTPFMTQCRPILQWLEKYGNWIFRKTETGDYEITGSTRQGVVSGSQKEYGFDSTISEAIHDYCGDIGLIGQSPIWFDKSDNAQGPYGEMETSKADYVDAIDRLPSTTKTVVELLTQYKKLVVDVAKMKVEFMTEVKGILDQQQTLLDMIKIKSDRNAVTDIPQDNPITTTDDPYDGRMYR